LYAFRVSQALGAPITCLLENSKKQEKDFWLSECQKNLFAVFCGLRDTSLLEFFRA
jgi:hypothetical protein